MFPLNYCGRISFWNPSMFNDFEVVRTNFFADFWTFRNFFDCNFAKNVAPSSEENESYAAHLKEQYILKKCWKPHQNRPINRHTILVWTMSPRTGRPSVTYKKTPIFALTTGALSSISPKLCMLIENVLTILKGVKQFSIQRIVFPTGAKMLICGHWRTG